jgi:hypothetical protein
MIPIERVDIVAVFLFFCQVAWLMLYRFLMIVSHEQGR